MRSLLANETHCRGLGHDTFKSTNGVTPLDLAEFASFNPECRLSL